jgi:hypothetical protein
MRQESKDLYAAGFDALMKRDWSNVSMSVEDMSRNTSFFPPNFENHMLHVLYSFVIYIYILNMY